MKLSAAALASLPLAVLASPASPLLERQAEEFCGQWDLVETGTFILYNNLWGMDNAESGEQCTTLVSESGNEISWSAAWTWIGDQYEVKSYPNAVLDVEPVALSEISGLPTSWSWSYTGDDLITNVAYDIFTATSADDDYEFEIMIWVGAIGGAGPISETGSTIGTPEIGGVTWDLYTGSHSQMTVYSFVAPSNIESYTGDLIDFTDYLQEELDFDNSQIVISVGAGTEPFVGENAVFTTDSYSLEIV